MRSRARWGTSIAAVAVCAVPVVVASNASGTTLPAGVSKACAKAIAHQRRVHPKLLRTAPPGGLTSLLGVLRQPATPRDVLPRGGRPTTGYSVLWIKYVRLVASAHRTRYFLIPGIAVDPLPPACRALLPAKDRRELAKFDREQRSGSVSLEAFDRHGGSGPLPFTKQVIEHGVAVIAPAPGARVAPAYGVVPDGVASITIVGATGRAVTAAASNNFFLMRVPVKLKAAAGGVKAEVFAVQWHASDGTLLKRFSESIKIQNQSGTFFGQ